MNTPTGTAKGGFRILLGKILCGIGLILLCVVFFLPSAWGGTSFVGETLESHGEFLVRLGTPFVFAFLAVPLLVLGWLARKTSFTRKLTWATCVVFILVPTVLIVDGIRNIGSFKASTHDWFDYGGLTVWVIFGVMMLLSVVALAKARMACKLPTIMFFSGLPYSSYAIWWFVYFTHNTTMPYGFPISAAACVLVSGGSFLWVMGLRAAMLSAANLPT